MPELLKKNLMNVKDSFFISLIFNRRGQPLKRLLFRRSPFLQSKLYWGAVFFLRSVHTFLRFLESNWSNDFGHAETGKGAKKRVVLRRENFSLLF